VFASLPEHIPTDVRCAGISMTVCVVNKTPQQRLGLLQQQLSLEGELPIERRRLRRCRESMIVIRFGRGVMRYQSPD
jgi:hypothetical protein